jgi:hypothetical protein
MEIIDQCDPGDIFEISKKIQLCETMQFDPNDGFKALKELLRVLVVEMEPLYSNAIMSEFQLAKDIQVNFSFDATTKAFYKLWKHLMSSKKLFKYNLVDDLEIDQEILESKEQTTLISMITRSQFILSDVVYLWLTKQFDIVTDTLMKCVDKSQQEEWSDYNIKLLTTDVLDNDLPSCINDIWYLYIFFLSLQTMNHKVSRELFNPSVDNLILSADVISKFNRLHKFINGGDLIDFLIVQVPHIEKKTIGELQWILLIRANGMVSRSAPSSDIKKITKNLVHFARTRSNCQLVKKNDFVIYINS